MNEMNPADNDYEAQMVEAFVNKADKPDKGLWYASAFSKYNVNGIDAMKWHWSWWAFFGTIWFLIYRKAYAAAGGLFLITLVAGVLVPFGGLVINILAGGFSTYFIYKSYKSKKDEIEAASEDPQSRIQMMKHVGGYNTWVLWAFPIIVILIGVGTQALKREVLHQELQNNTSIQIQTNEYQKH